MMNFYDFWEEKVWIIGKVKEKKKSKLRKKEYLNRNIWKMQEKVISK